MKNYDVDHTLSKISLHRDRFVSWGTVVVSLIFISAMWTTAPSLKINIPLSGAQASLNVGYVYAIGPFLSMCAYSWVVGSLAAMRTYQVELIKKVDFWYELDVGQRLTFFGPHNQLKIFGVSSGDIFICKVINYPKLFFVFIIPVISLFVICSNMTMNIRYYNETDVIKKIDFQIERGSNMSTIDWGFDYKKIEIYSILTESVPQEGVDFTFQNRDFNRDCAKVIYLNHLLDSGDFENIVFERLEGLEFECVPLDLPNFNVAVNWWVNFFSLLVMAFLSNFGIKYFLFSDFNEIDKKWSGALGAN